MTFNGPNFLLLFMLYLFLMFTHALERLLSKSEQSGSKLPYKMILFFGILSIGTLTIIFSLSNLILVAILLLYFVYSILQFYPYSMSNTFYEILLRPFFKILILSSVSFFSQANFIPLQLQYELLPLALFHIFGLIQIQVKNTAGSDRPMTYYQQLLMKHSKSLKMTAMARASGVGVAVVVFTLLSVLPAAQRGGVPSVCAWSIMAPPFCLITWQVQHSLGRCLFAPGFCIVQQLLLFRGFDLG